MKNILQWAGRLAVSIGMCSVMIVSSFSFLLVPVASASAVTLTSPASGATVSGSTTFTASAPGASTVEYLIAGHSVISGSVPSGGSFAYTFDTTTITDGQTQVTAVARDGSGNVIGMSQPQTFTIQNGSSVLRILSPDPTISVSGTVNWQVQGSDPRGIQAYIFVLDGKLLTVNYSNASQNSYSLDTTKLSNGPHILLVQMLTGTGFPPVTAAASEQIMVNNGSMPLELHTNFRNVFLQVGQSTTLSAITANTDGSSQSCSGASYSSDRSSVAQVSGATVSGVSAGFAQVTVSCGGKTTKVYVTVSGQSGFSHFSKDGHILSAYDPSRSLFVRTLFMLGPNDLSTVPALPGALRQAGVNTISTGFYFNPADNPSAFPDFPSWQRAAGGALDASLATIKNNGFSMLGTGDDIQRSSDEMTNSLTNPWAGDALRLTMDKLVQSGIAVSLEMQDEVGGSPVPSQYRQIMAKLNSAAARPPVTWPPAGLAGPDVYSAWVGDSTMSDYSSFYWTYVQDPYASFPWGNSIAQTRSEIDKVLLDRFPYIQADRPKYLLVSLNGTGYFKRTAGDSYHTGVDALHALGTYPEENTAEIMYAAAMGMAGVRAYGYDGAGGSNDGHWQYERSHQVPDATNQNEMQTGASPFSNDPGVKDRWQAMSNGFNLIKTIEPYVLSQQINAVDMGPSIVTGARQGSNGRMFMAVNMSDTIKTAQVDLSPYVYSGASSVTRYHLAGLISGSETVANDTLQTLTLAPGEAVVWIFTPPAFVAPPVVVPPVTVVVPPVVVQTSVVTTTVQTQNSVAVSTPAVTGGNSLVVGAWPLTDGSGTTASDTSGNGRTLSLIGNPAWTSVNCKLGSCLSFNGVSQSAQVNLDLSGTKAVTVSFWMNVPSYQNNDSLAMEFASHPFGFNGTNGGFMINPNSSQNGGGYFEAGLLGNVGYNQIIFMRPSQNTWHHYTFVFDKSGPAATEVTPYVDDVPVPYTHLVSSNNTNTFAQDTLNIMSRNGQALFLPGLLQDIKIYPRALSAAEIAPVVVVPPVTTPANTTTNTTTTTTSGTTNGTTGTTNTTGSTTGTNTQTSGTGTTQGETTQTTQTTQTSTGSGNTTTSNTSTGTSSSGTAGSSVFTAPVIISGGSSTGGGGGGGAVYIPVIKTAAASPTNVAAYITTHSATSADVSSVTSGGTSGSGTVIVGLSKIIAPTRILKYGSSGKDVSALQQFLSLIPSVYPEKQTTGYFGTLTQKAVIRFQEKYAADILVPAGVSRGTGIVSTNTLNKIKAMIKAGR